jgi:hypothetical protein
MMRLSDMIRNDFGIKQKVKNLNQKVEEYGERNDRHLQELWRKSVKKYKLPGIRGLKWPRNR